MFRRIRLILRGYVSAAEHRVERVAAEEELIADSPLGDITKARMLSSTASCTRLAADYQLLGVKPEASLEVVEAAWRSLALRADPKRFPAGSEEEKKAADILDSVNDAYTRIREELNPTEGRFGQLEL